MGSVWIIKFPNHELLNNDKNKLIQILFLDYKELKKSQTLFIFSRIIFRNMDPTVGEFSIPAFIIKLYDIL